MTNQKEKKNKSFFARFSVFFTQKIAFKKIQNAIN